MGWLIELLLQLIIQFVLELLAWPFAKRWAHKRDQHREDLAALRRRRRVRND